MTWQEFIAWLAAGVVIGVGVRVLAQAAARKAYDWWEQQHYGPGGREGREE